MLARLIALVVVIGVLGVGVHYLVNGRLPFAPPTPAEQAQSAADNLQAAGQNLSDAAQDATQAAADAAEQTLTAGQSAAQNAAETTRANVESAAADAMNAVAGKLEGLSATLRTGGALTDTNLDYDKAAEVVDGLNLPESVKSRTLSVLRDIQSSPGDAKAKFDSLIESLKSN